MKIHEYGMQIFRATRQGHLIFVTGCLLALLSVGARAATIPAASCSAAAVTTAVNVAASGDIITVPPGTCDWSSGIAVGKSVTVQGSGVDVTNISGAGIDLSAANAKLTGFTFNGGKLSVTGAGFRIYNNKFVTSSEIVTISGAYGVVDSNTFKFSGTNAELIKIYGPANSWASPSSYGTANAVYVEDNVFTTTEGLGSSQVVQGNYNARFVVRYNTITNAKIDAHGIWSNGSPAYYGDWSNPTEHSARHYEIYGNHFRPSAGTPTWWFSIELRGGSGIVFNNEFTGTSMYNNEGRPNVYLHDYCNVAKDGNCLGYYLTPDRYPGQEQLGRGVSQTSEPLYLWNNTVNGTVFATSREDWPVAAAIAQYGRTYTADDIVKKNRDYYDDASGFNGTAGVGIGPRASRSTTCTIGVAYWATDENKLYKCTGSNAWALYYTPYVYPHPLRTSSSSPTLSPPQNLRLVQ